MPLSQRTFSYWPGGIPSYIKFDEVPISVDDFERLTCDWILFVKEKWVSKPSNVTDPEYEPNQRRALVSEWAQAPQSLRDHFQTRALTSPPSPPVWDKDSRNQYVPKNDGYIPEWYTCIAPLDAPRNLALWTKLRIISYDFTITNSDICPVGVVQASPYSAALGVEPRDFMKTAFVENANFDMMYMTVHGTVTFLGRNQWVFADQRSLEDGMLLITEIESNGDVVLKMRPTIIELRDMYNFRFGLGKGLEEYRGNCGFDEAFADVEEGEVGKPIDMSKPIFGIFNEVFYMGHIDDGPGAWPAIIERFAPGYLALEAKGRESEYDHSRFFDSF